MLQVYLTRDALTKYVRCEHLKNKTGWEVIKAFERISTPTKVEPKDLQSKSGKEILNIGLKQLMGTFGQNHFSTHLSSNAVDRISQ